MWFCTQPRQDTVSAMKILSDWCWNVLPHQEQRMRWVYKHCRDSQQYNSSDKGKKKQKRRTEKLGITDNQTETSKGTSYMYDDIIHNRTTPLYHEATAAKLQFILINEYNKEKLVPRK